MRLAITVKAQTVQHMTVRLKLEHVNPSIKTVYQLSIKPGCLTVSGVFVLVVCLNTMTQPSCQAECSYMVTLTVINILSLCAEECQRDGVFFVHIL